MKKISNFVRKKRVTSAFYLLDELSVENKRCSIIKLYFVLRVRSTIINFSVSFLNCFGGPEKDRSMFVLLSMG